MDHLSDENQSDNLSHSETEGKVTPLVSNRWILLGSLAMMLGLAMGFIMSALGK